MRSPGCAPRSSICGKVWKSSPTKCATSSPRSEFDRMSTVSLEPEDSPLDPALPSAPALAAAPDLPPDGATDRAASEVHAAGEIENAQAVAEPARDGWALIALVP